MIGLKHRSHRVDQVARAAEDQQGAKVDKVGIRGSRLLQLTLSALREHRAQLRDQETRVSYWRHIVQARRHVLEAGGEMDEGRAAALARLLAADSAHTRRTAVLAFAPVDERSPLAALEALWGRLATPGDAAERSSLIGELTAADTGLSAYRLILQQRSGEARAELIARYRVEPRLCLSVLPKPRRRPTR